MKAGSLYWKTFPFVISKLLLGLLTAALIAGMLALCFGIWYLFRDSDNSPIVGMIVGVVWLCSIGVIRFVVMHWLGYLIKAGHVAVLTEAVTSGVFPANQVAYGKDRVIQRFGTSNVYFVIDKLVSGAVRQIQKVLEKLGSALDFIPGMKAIMGIAKFFVSISLNYIDECFLGWTFYCKDQGAFKSAADGVVIYVQNWKKLLKSAAGTMFMVFLIMAIIIVLCFLGFAGRSSALSGPLSNAMGLQEHAVELAYVVAFALACIVAWVIKWAFIDSYILVRMVASYMEVAPSTQITFDLYGKISGWSGKCRKLFEKGQKEPQPTPTPAFAGAGAAGNVDVRPEPSSGYFFCGQCGAKNNAGTKFCRSCGAKL
jgi:hypothetical protein